MEVLDTSAPAPPPPSRSGWAVGAAALVVVACAAVAAPGPDTGPDVALKVSELSGSALEGQQFVRFWYEVSASGGSAELDRVEMVLGEQRQQVQAPARIEDGSDAQLLVDVVLDCPEAARAVAAATLDITYRADGEREVVRLPLPLQGSLPRLVTRRCARG